MPINAPGVSQIQTQQTFSDARKATSWYASQLQQAAVQVQKDTANSSISASQLTTDMQALEHASENFKGAQAHELQVAAQEKHPLARDRDLLTAYGDGTNGDGLVRNTLGAVSSVWSEHPELASSDAVQAYNSTVDQVNSIAGHSLLQANENGGTVSAEIPTMQYYNATNSQ